MTSQQPTNPPPAALHSCSPLFRRRQIALLCAAARMLRDASRDVPWARLTTTDRKRILRTIERLESDLIMVRILARGRSERIDRKRHSGSPTKRTQELTTAEDDAV